MVVQIFFSNFFCWKFSIFKIFQIFRILIQNLTFLLKIFLNIFMNFILNFLEIFWVWGSKKVGKLRLFLRIFFSFSTFCSIFGWFEKLRGSRRRAGTEIGYFWNFLIFTFFFWFLVNFAEKSGIISGFWEGKIARKNKMVVGSCIKRSN